MGLSDQGGDYAEMQSIMNGGDAWMDRMTALLKAKEEAQAAVNNAKIVGDIAEALRVAEEIKRDALGALASAKDTVTKATQHANEMSERIVLEANEKAAAVMADAAAKLEAAEKTLAEARESSARLMGNANDRMAHAEMRQRDVDDLFVRLQKQLEESETAMAEAKASKEKYDAMVERIKKSLAVEVDE